MKRIVLTGTVFIAITYALGRFSYGLFMPEISAALQLSEASAGSIASMAYAGYCAALLSASSLVRGIGGRGALQLAGICVLLGLILMGVANHWMGLAIGLVLTGLSSGWASPAYGQVVHAALQPEQQDRGNAWINSGTSWGLVVMGPIAYFFSADWRLAYLGFAVLAAGAILMQWRFLPRAQVQERRRAPGLANRWWQTGGRLMGAAFAVGAASAVYWTFARSMWQEWHGLPDERAAFLWLIMGISGILGGFAGAVVERIGQAAAYRWGLLVLMVSICSIAGSGLPILMVSALLFGITYIFLTGVFIVWGTRCYPRHAAFGISLAFLMLGAGQFGGSMAAGVLIETTSYAVAFLSFGILGLAGLAIRPSASSPD